jgi:hypothetical protein
MRIYIMEITGSGERPSSPLSMAEEKTTLLFSNLEYTRPKTPITNWLLNKVVSRLLDSNGMDDGEFIRENVDFDNLCNFDQAIIAVSATRCMVVNCPGTISITIKALQDDMQIYNMCSTFIVNDFDSFVAVLDFINENRTPLKPRSRPNSLRELLT